MGSRYKHDHNTEYTAWAKRKLIEGIKEAREKLEAARLGVGWGMAMANINRRGARRRGGGVSGFESRWPATVKSG